MHKLLEEKMRKPTYLTPEMLNLTKETYNEVIKDRKIDEREYQYLKNLHYVLFGVIEDDRETIINEIREVSQWKIKVK